jgi:hypothetical protein
MKSVPTYPVIILRSGIGALALNSTTIAEDSLGALGVTGGLDSRTGLAFTTRYALEFFDGHLRGAPRDALCGAPLVSASHFETT